MKAHNPATPKKQRPILRYFYPQSRATGGLTRLMFVYKKKDAQGGMYSINFQTGISVQPANWCKLTKHVTPAEPNYNVLNSQLDTMHALALMAIDEGKTQDELRALLDLNDTRLVKPYQRVTTHRPQGGVRAVGSRTTVTSAPPVELVNTAPKHAGISTPKPEEAPQLETDAWALPFAPFFPTPVMVPVTPPEQQPDFSRQYPGQWPTAATPTSKAPETKEKPAPAAPETAREYYVVDGEDFTTQEAAVLAAWHLATVSQAEVPVYRVQTAIVGLITPVPVHP